MVNLKVKGWGIMNQMQKRRHGMNHIHNKLFLKTGWVGIEEWKIVGPFGKPVRTYAWMDKM